MYAPDKLGLGLIQTKSELYRICGHFRFYNTRKYILVEGMNDYYPCEKLLFEYFFQITGCNT